MELLDRVAVVTGAGGAVGAAVARRFADEGARLLLADEDKEALDQIRQEGGHAAESVDGLSIDLASASQVDALVGRAVARFGRIDILVNAMGMAEEPPWSEPGPGGTEAIRASEASRTARRRGESFSSRGAWLMSSGAPGSR